MANELEPARKVLPDSVQAKTRERVRRHRVRLAEGQCCLLIVVRSDEVEDVLIDTGHLTPQDADDRRCIEKAMQRFIDREIAKARDGM